MIWHRHIPMFTLLLGLAIALSGPAGAHADDGDDMQAVKKGQEELRSEVSELREEVKGLRNDMKKVLTELRGIKAAQRNPRQQRKRPAMDLLGKTAPVESFTTMQDQTESIGGKSDDVKVVMFYTSWCGFCKRALPGFEKLHNKYKDKGVDVIAINLDDRKGKRAKTAEDTIKHYNSLNLSIPLYMDDEKKIGRAYKVSSYPTSFVLGKNGLVEAVHIGGPKDLDQRIATQLDKLLAGESLVGDKPKKQS